MIIDQIKEKVLERLKNRDDLQNVGESSLNIAAEDALITAVELTHQTADELPEGFYQLVFQMAVYQLQHEGTEAFSSSSHSGISETMLEDYPSNVQRLIRRFRRLI